MVVVICQSKLRGPRVMPDPGLMGVNARLSSESIMYSTQCLNPYSTIELPS